MATKPAGSASEHLHDGAMLVHALWVAVVAAEHGSAKPSLASMRKKLEAAYNHFNNHELLAAAGSYDAVHHPNRKGRKR